MLMAEVHYQSNWNGASDEEMNRLLHCNIKKLWQELERSPTPDKFLNLEGGGIEQQPDRRLRFHHCANYAAAMTILAGEMRPLRLLELGCGTGALSRAFARTMPDNWTLVATDYSKPLIEYARNVNPLPNLRFECLNVQELTFSFLKEFDAVLMLEIIEHLDLNDVKAVFFRLHQGLKHGGRVIISTLDRSPFRRRFSGYYPHKIEYTYKMLTALLNRPQFNPFTDFRIFRLVSRKTVKSAVRAEEMGGYLVNRFIGLVNRLVEKKGRVAYYQNRFLSRLSRFYLSLSRRTESSCKDCFAPIVSHYLDDFRMIESSAGNYDSHSFSLIATLRKI
jgi:2-polyprenyl-3-methyl-5-hydroxy-6-metoxy-1,4-benzoquinol methylase|uniref:Class I SAM-dependent methyltransferase n=1 Tax=candidate division WOR-3 bacterium TaxID=2052148 RepID=A0A7V3PSW0_UNCW3